jgi:hypothetical protein
MEDVAALQKVTHTATTLSDSHRSSVSARAVVVDVSSFVSSFIISIKQQSGWPAAPAEGFITKLLLESCISLSLHNAKTQLCKLIYDNNKK